MDKKKNDILIDIILAMDSVIGRCDACNKEVCAELEDLNKKYGINVWEEMMVAKKGEYNMNTHCKCCNQELKDNKKDLSLCAKCLANACFGSEKEFSKLEKQYLEREYAKKRS